MQPNEMGRGCAPELFHDDQDWLRAEQEQESWLRTEQDPAELPRRRARGFYIAAVGEIHHRGLYA